MTLTLTDEEAEQLREMLTEWVHEGFTSTPNALHIAILRKMGLHASDMSHYSEEYAALDEVVELDARLTHALNAERVDTPPTPFLREPQLTDEDRRLLAWYRRRA